MYRLGDERAAIREIQKYLHFISDRTITEIPRVAIDGVFGEETKDAVRVFQKCKNLSQSGAVDYETFTALFKEFSEARLLFEAEEYFIDEGLFPFKRGDTGREVLYLNLMLDELKSIFRDIERIDLKPYFSLSTENAVREVRKIFMLEDSAIIDLALFRRMRYELKLRGRESNPM